MPPQPLWQEGSLFHVPGTRMVTWRKASKKGAATMAPEGGSDAAVPAPQCNDTIAEPAPSYTFAIGSGPNSEERQNLFAKMRSVYGMNPRPYERMKVDVDWQCPPCCEQLQIYRLSLNLKCQGLELILEDLCGTISSLMKQAALDHPRVEEHMVAPELRKQCKSTAPIGKRISHKKLAECIRHYKEHTAKKMDRVVEKLVRSIEDGKFTCQCRKKGRPGNSSCRASD